MLPIRTVSKTMVRSVSSHIPASAEAVTKLAQQLIRIPSITPDDNGCQTVIRQRLEPLGFQCETMQYQDVTNLWCLRQSPLHSAPTVAYLGHTDVVPVGPPSSWTLPPFGGQIHDQNMLLYGRGAVDMKGGIASFVVGLERFLQDHDSLPYSLAVLLTSDEEGDAKYGTRVVLEELQKRGITIDMAIIGEPSSLHQVGDVVKVGRRGSLGGTLSIIGVQGHVAYSHLARNPIHESLGALKDLVDERWDDGTTDFPPTSFQISNIQSGTGALNVIPGFKTVQFNFRYSPAVTDTELKRRVHGILDKHGLQYTLEWSETTVPFESAPGGELVEQAMASVSDVMGYSSRPCTSGGTSDGRFVAATFPHAQIVELGHRNETIHKIDECVSLKDLKDLSLIYKRLLDRLRVVEERKQDGQEYTDHHVSVAALP
ncbi:succinyl-diaminopimelate desuccinylase [Nitzschia inconspicua]|uniref:Succinyl-diaminopimelate desuccinylase n=1 Tax=Nitzschia inconspicua TaxID=303405 RepID=A0A9K3KAI6_9STRA|nr:succinyl-diaminopimelate desuccinylase [Nitzschia inconspicua]